MKKYNQILSCTRTENGAWRVWVLTPHGQYHTHLYFGYPKQTVLYQAQRADFDSGAGLLFQQPPRRPDRER